LFFLFNKIPSKIVPRIAYFLIQEMGGRRVQKVFLKTAENSGSACGKWPRMMNDCKASIEPLAWSPIKDWGNQSETITSCLSKLVYSSYLLILISKRGRYIA